MPGQRRVQTVPQPIPGHKGLGGAALLAGAAIEHHGARGLGGLQEGFDAQRSGKSACAQQVVAAAVAVAAVNALVPRQAAALLRKTGESVILCQKADDGPAAAVGGGEGGGDVADALFHREALFFQNVTIQRRGLLLLQGELRKGPDGVCHLAHQVRLVLDGGRCRT